MTDVSLPAADRSAAPPEALLRRIQGPGPRYTSYPTADRFGTDFGARDLEAALYARRQRSDAGAVTPLSLYVHVPFCASLCYYCACNKTVTRHHERAGPYLQALDREIQFVTEQMGVCRTASQVHLGGGTPTFLSDAELLQLMRILRRSFHIGNGAEVSIEVDPRTVDASRLNYMRTLGFNRISLGIQDFDPDVQRAVHREQSFDMVREQMTAARQAGFESINIDLIYGLPRQTPQTFQRTLAQVSELRPDRIALYAYAHLPDRFKAQRRIHPADLPDGTQRVAMLADALATLGAQGYDYIGMDHFALPDDSLAIAKRQGQLHRNFQGYSTHADCDLVGLGVSAIGRIGNCLYQNEKTLPTYFEALDADRLPVARGHVLDSDDQVRRDIIMALMCHGRVEFSAIREQHGVDVPTVFATELERLRPLEAEGLLEREAGAIQVTASGWYVVRAIAMVFDRYLQQHMGHERFSRIV